MIRTDHTKVLGYIRENENLRSLFSYYLNNCITLTNPYHNANHTLAMIYHMCRIYEESQKEGRYDFTLSHEDLTTLLGCAIFHDFNHSAGKFDDKTNISIAISEMEAALGTTVKGEVKDILWATCYPYIIPDPELNLYQRIIRECDILVAFADDFLTQTLLGLKTEMIQKDWAGFLEAEKKFLESGWAELKLEYSKEVIRENKDDLLGIIETLKDIL